MSEFYTYLKKNESLHNQPAEELSLQFRDILLKQVTLIGAPQVLMAMTPLAAADGSPADKAPESQLSEKW